MLNIQDVTCCQTYELRILEILYSMHAYNAFILEIGASGLRARKLLKKLNHYY